MYLAIILRPEFFGDFEVFKNLGIELSIGVKHESKIY